MDWLQRDKNAIWTGYNESERLSHGLELLVRAQQMSFIVFTQEIWYSRRKLLTQRNKISLIYYSCLEKIPSKATTTQFIVWIKFLCYQFSF